jgi:hypothetical protein
VSRFELFKNNRGGGGASEQNPMQKAKKKN